MASLIPVNLRYDFRVLMGDFGMVNLGGLLVVWSRDSNIVYYFSC